jgi:p-cumate 2,3-dioxygenase subunit beta
VEDSAWRATRQQVEDFLYADAALLDDWRLQEWSELLTEDATYVVPATDAPEGDPASTLAVIADDAAQLRARVEQLQSKWAWAENPPSRTRRLITNVRIRSVNERGEAMVTANFVVYRFRHERMEAFVGRYEHVLVSRGGQIRMRHRKAILDLESLRPHGRVSIIL